MRPEFTYLLAEIRLPKLERLRIEDGAVASLDSISQLIKKHEKSLERIVIRRIDLVVSNGTSEDVASRQWEALMQSMMKSRMRIRSADVGDVGFVTEDGQEGCRCRCRLEGREEDMGFGTALLEMGQDPAARELHGWVKSAAVIGDTSVMGEEESSEEWRTVWSIDYRYETQHGYLWRNGRLL